MAIMVYALDGGGPKDSENTLNSFLTKRDNDVFWQTGAELGFGYAKWMVSRYNSNKRCVEVQSWIVLNSHRVLNGINLFSDLDGQFS